MKRSNPLSILIEQSRSARDQAGKTLADSRHKQQQITQQLHALKRYREEYSERLGNALRDGVNTATLDNYRRFIASLDAAIAQTLDNLAQVGQRVDDHREHWRQRQKRLSSFSLLSEQRATKERYRQGKIEQRQNDELNNNTQARKMSQSTQSQHGLR